ncbi:hypothetical protein GDO81_005010 [Engystomops pustulosus]|uniref:Uncharacterized protein n=1 Tax=Engystomops pustulosus TaxID=76066 RepID=A0AAV7CL17_ENGPU|nr:hypothetical protein GDO81_005010 [Engystomops pustulosus]KAG8585390.1 hypothetical protein GDO81_005010 [Engystomops pustulosus]
MDPGHHTAYLLAILICILLLLLAVSVLLMCYFRRIGFNIIKRKSSIRLESAMRDQSTSMTNCAWNFVDQKPPIYTDLNDPQPTSFLISVDRSKHPTSPLSLDSHIVYISDDEEGTRTSGLHGKSQRKKSNTSALKLMLSSGASILGSVLERSSMFNLKAKRRSSSLKSGINTDILMVPLDVSCLDTREFQATNLPANMSRSSTLLCDNSCDQQFTWDTAGLSVQSIHLTQKESCAGEREQEEGPNKKAMVQFRNPESLQPKSWFVSIENRPVSDGVQLNNEGRKELNNVASLDSGVDTTEGLLRPGSGGFNVIPKVLSTHGSENYVPFGSSKESNRGEETHEDNPNLHMTHQEAARKLNPGYSGRSLWEKREERPLIGVN